MMIEIVCPRCHNSLTREAAHDLICGACGSHYPERGPLDVLLTGDEWTEALHSIREHAEAHRRYLPARRFPLAVQYYDWWAGKMWQKAPQSAETALELMCGGLELGRRMPPGIRETVGLDIDPAILEKALRELDEGLRKRLHPVCGTALRMPFKSESFDLVLVMGGLHHVRPNMDAVLAEMSRVLKPGGTLIASEPANDHRLVRAIRHWQYRHSPLQGKDDGEDGFTKREIQKTLARHGLSLQSYETFGFIAYPFLGNMDLLPVFTKSRNHRLGQWMIAMDEALGKTPFIRSMAWASLFKAVKPPSNEKR